jgi:excisionase family DNA binding protein
MTIQKDGSTGWLTLSQASKMLGVHGATLREWTDKGLIESFQTPGGHRRFALADIRAFLELGKSPKGRRSLPGLMDRALAHTQSEIQVTGSNQSWMSTFAPDARQRQRELGRRLLGVMIQYLARESQAEALLAEAREIGGAYGRECFDAGLSLADTIRAFFFFRDSITEVTVWLPQSGGSPRQDELRFFRQVSEFLNFVHLAMVDAYSAREAAAG